MRSRSRRRGQGTGRGAEAVKDANRSAETVSPDPNEKAEPQAAPPSDAEISFPHGKAAAESSD